VDNTGAPASATEGLKNAGPWSRYFARQIDFLVFGFIAWSALLTVFQGDGRPAFMGDRAIDALLIVPLALFIEVPVYAAFGWTPGKWVFGITVRHTDGGRLDFGQVLRRNLMLWPFGFGFGLPIVNLYFLIRNYLVAKDGRRCRWDDVPKYVVRQKPIGRLHFSSGIVLAVLLSFGLSVLSGIYGPDAGGAGFLGIGDHLPAGPNPVIWVNPLTNSSTTLFAGWKNAEEPGAAAPTASAPVSAAAESVYRFRNAESLILFGREPFSGDLRAYIDHLEAGNSFGMLEDKKVELDQRGTTAYVLSYHKISDDNPAARKLVRIDVKVWQISPGTYWRTVVYSPLDNERERALARALAEGLERTSLAAFTPVAP